MSQDFRDGPNRLITILLLLLVGMRFSVYVVSNFERNVIFAGLTDYLKGSVFCHKTFSVRPELASPTCTRLVFYENFKDITDAAQRLLELSPLVREMRTGFITRKNPEWKDLSVKWYNPNEIMTVRTRMRRILGL